MKNHPVINISHLKEYRDGAQAPGSTGPAQSSGAGRWTNNGAPEWLVDRLLDHRKVKRGTRHIDQYLVEWKGYPISEATWEPIENLTRSMDSVKKFNDKQNVQLSTAVTVVPRSFAQVAKSRSPTRGG